MSSTQPLVSVILPFLNAGRAFEPAIRSILAQTMTDFELLLCDDGSTDGSLEVAKSFRDPRIFVWTDGKTRGLAGRLNECVDRARGAYIARMDADDLSYPERLERQLAHLEAHPEIDLVGCRMLIFGDQGQPLGKRRLPKRHEEIVANPALGFGVGHPTWMARAQWFRKYRYDPAALRYEDIELLYRAHSASRFANLPDVLYAYREPEGGFAKRYKTRRGRIRYLSARTKVFGAGFVVKASIAEAVKSVADAGLCVASARYSMLRRREEPLTPDDLKQWQRVLDLTSKEALPEAAFATPARSAQA